MANFPQKLETLASSQSLTTSYVATSAKSVIDVSNFDEGILYIDYTPLSAAAHLTYKVEFSPDGSTFYQETAEEVSSGASEVYLKTRDFNGSTSGASHKFASSLPVADRYLKVSVKNSAASGTVSMKALFSVLNA